VTQHPRQTSWFHNLVALDGKRSGEAADNEEFWGIRGKRGIPVLRFDPQTKRSLKPNSIFGSLSKRSLKPNSLFGTYGKRTMKPNSLFGTYGKRTMKPTSLFGTYSKKSLKPNSLFGTYGKKSWKPYSPKVDAKRTMKPNSLFGSYTKRNYKPNGLFSVGKRDFPLFWVDMDQGTDNEEDDLTIDDVEDYVELLEDGEEENQMETLKRSEDPSFWAARGKRGDSDDFFATRGRREDTVPTDFDFFAARGKKSSSAGDEVVAQ